MQNIIKDFTENTNKIFDLFNVSGNYFLKVLEDTSFQIISENDMFLVKYNENDNEITNLILTNKGKPLIFDKDGYTMIIAIDCVKVALVFDNNFNKNS